MDTPLVSLIIFPGPSGQPCSWKHDGRAPLPTPTTEACEGKTSALGKQNMNVVITDTLQFKLVTADCNGGIVTSDLK